MSKSTDSTAISTMCGSATGVRVPEAGTAKDDRREMAAEGGSDGFGVGIADMVKACLVKTDMARLGGWSRCMCLWVESVGKVVLPVNDEMGWDGGQTGGDGLMRCDC
jgi:hypothetical protein